ncbi:D-3-phosphoglycerate dehydrogenase [Paucilactobacillus hokkaidonensis JCM 18461]|uniref:D-3-phosphoglycerate dehydrogenase n=2 Tax=Paucilactobacillus hokkaidonensis TaxID=1193095 RepID=A0A0A1GWR4_9LACO|nr:NAD(P)-dependent oxidoreductase [Paucilactobacillus hokkaidonensis]KRO10169.1 D-3-phosphoglycerate dehydrogenase [Paucilactobacillus hokkaidonensis]BAP85318.1 D-3-phosphoglycerate dehydrogenase [Paucilactobacillus hokkaidonensis JCM 18461]
MSENLLAISPINDDQVHLLTDLDVNVFTPKELDQKISPADITIMYGWKQDISSKLLDATNSKLKWIHAISAGVDYLPLATLTKRGIKLTNASGIHATSISQSVLAYILHFVRGLDIAREHQIKHQWEKNADTNPATISDYKYVVFGTGHIGQQIGRLLQTLGGHTIGVNTTGHPAEYFDETIALNKIDDRVWHADVIINIMPLTDDTHHFYDSDFFAHFENLFLFVNVGRGPSVDSKALVAALEDGHVSHAALDVFETEPLPDDSPFWSMKNMIVTPHNTGVIRHFKKAQLELFMPNLKQYLQDGSFKYNQVDLIKGY